MNGIAEISGWRYQMLLLVRRFLEHLEALVGMEAGIKAATSKGDRTRLQLAIVCSAIVCTTALACLVYLRISDLSREAKRKNTVDSIITMYGEAARQRLKEKFAAAGLSYPPRAIKMLGLKTEKALEIYSDEGASVIHFVCTYPILGTSGILGPKLREGDKQMPEGFYRIREFEPNSSYHVALRVDYPSQFDKEMGKLDGRTNLGSDIMIHGCDRSIGCLAMGDPASEDLFVLVHDVGLSNTELMMSPYDFRKPPEGVCLPEKPSWIAGVYSDLKNQICMLPIP